MDYPDQEEQVMVAVYDGEPLARMAAQRLQEEQIDCMVQAVGVGPGGWGMAANLPYALYVHGADEARTRELLELPPRAMAGPGSGATASAGRAMVVLLFIAAVAAVLILGDRLFGSLLDP